MKTTVPAKAFVFFLLAAFSFFNGFAQTVKWPPKPSSATLKRGVGVVFPFADVATGAADIKLTGDGFVSETGEIALVKAGDLNEVTTVPATGYRKAVPFDDLLATIAVIRLPGGKYAKLKLGSFQQGLSNENFQYRSANITYMVSESGEATAAQPVSFDTRLAGKWKLRIATGMRHSTDGLNVYRHIVPGAELGVIRLAADGKYTWEGIYWNKGKKSTVTGTAQRDQPYNAEDGLTYWKINDGVNEYLIMWNPRNNRPFTVRYKEGGVIANGERTK